MFIVIYIKRVSMFDDQDYDDSADNNDDNDFKEQQYSLLLVSSKIMLK